MKTDDLVYLRYNNHCKCIIKVIKIRKDSSYPHKFVINGIEKWDMQDGIVSKKRVADYYAFKTYSIYDKKTRIKDILMIEEL